MLTTGKIVFAAAFFVVFIIGMLWAYRKDSSTNKLHFSGASKILVFVAFVLLALFIYVKMRHRL